MKKIISLFGLIVLILSCNTTEPPPTKPPAPKPEITLAQEDASAIEAWIKITTTNIELPASHYFKKKQRRRTDYQSVSQRQCNIHRLTAPQNNLHIPGIHPII